MLGPEKTSCPDNDADGLLGIALALETTDNFRDFLGINVREKKEDCIEALLPVEKR